MFAKLPERQIHRVRWGLVVGWLLLIISMFYDPLSAILTEPEHLFGPKTAEICFEFQGKCLPITPYTLGPRIFWGMVIPSSIFFLVLFGHEGWRRICPLSFLSQLPRALGWQSQRSVKKNSWLNRHYLYLQWALFFTGLVIRLLFVNSDGFLLEIFLVLTIISAITVGFVYRGKTWCNYFCPMAPVQIIYSEPRGIFSSNIKGNTSRSITQSMCRKIDNKGQEKSACVGCQSLCLDIDGENYYWSKINQPHFKLIYYSYLGLVIGFYLYFALYSGNWDFLCQGSWNETNQLETLFNPGFYLFDQAIPIPKIIAVPLTLAFFSRLSYLMGVGIEKAYKQYNQKSKSPLPLEEIHHRLFTMFTLFAFNCFFFLGVYPTLDWVPFHGKSIIALGAIILSISWFIKVWQCSFQNYIKERNKHRLNRQLGGITANSDKISHR